MEGIEGVFRLGHSPSLQAEMCGSLILHSQCNEVQWGFHFLGVVFMERSRVLIVLSVGSMLFLWVGTWFLLGPMEPEERGTIGDMFGAVNALFSGFAFLGLIYTIILQKNELSLQRQELELTRKELSKSAEAQEKSEIALSMQARAMQQTAKINLLTASIQSLASRIQGLRLSGESSVVQANMEIRDRLLRKHAAAVRELESLMDDVLESCE